MAYAQRQVISGQHYSGTECFDMWHDYMNLSKLLLRRRDPVPAVDHDTPKRRARGGCPSARKDSTSSSSLSSLSDHSLNGKSSDYCRFCKQNGETANVYGSHKLKDEDGRVLCPILSRYTCPICQATGDQAHTRKYCPQLQRQGAKDTQREAHCV